MALNFNHDGWTGHVELNNPPVNAINAAMRRELLDAARSAEKLNLERVIVSGLGRAFAAGADAKEFDGDPIQPHLPDVLDAIDQSFVPWIAAINGVALGGGAEIALACRMRIMHPKAQIGFPEVSLGVIPGAGGTQRLPRLIDLENALDMICFGKPISAAKAQSIGLIQDIDDDVVQAALEVNAEDLVCRVPTWKLPFPDWDQVIADRITQKIDHRMARQNAPKRALEIAKFGSEMPFELAIQHERNAFLTLRTEPQARALRHMFFAERAAKLPSDIENEPADMNDICVVGGGTMGAGIAYACMSAGYSILLIEEDADGIERARYNIGRLIQAGVERGLINEAKKVALEANISYSNDYAATAKVDLVIEAAFENMDVKKNIFAQLDAHVPDHAILATNTSYLDVNEIADCTKNPSRVVGLHFFAPAHIMRLLEVVRGQHTSDHALSSAYAIAKKLRKVPVLAGVCDGFIGNRILARYREAADTILMEGSTPWDIDAAMVNFGYAMGPYQAQDMSGLDIAYANRRRQDATRDPNRRYIPISDRLVDMGRLGKKVGLGWYRYPDGKGRVDDPLIEDLIHEEAHVANVTRTKISGSVIQQQLLLAMINEAADILGEGIAHSAAEIDLVTVLGYGFPRWRGGLMHYADELGVASIIKQITNLSKSDPVAWKVSDVLMHCERTGTKLSDYHLNRGDS